MEKANYVKITEGGQAVCFVSSQFERISDVIGALSEAISADGGDEVLKDNILVRCGNCTPITEAEWTTKAEEQKIVPCEERIVDIDLDAETAVLSDWKDRKRSEVSGEIWRLTGCYEMSMSNGKLDSDQFITELMNHCSLQVSNEQGGPAFVGMQM